MTNKRQTKANARQPSAQKNMMWFDMETTGLGSYVSQDKYVPEHLAGKVFKNDALQLEVGVYEVGFGRDSRQVKNILGHTDIPIEEGATEIFEMHANALSQTKKTEKAMMREFGQELIQTNTRVIAGYNIQDYDAPLLLKRMQELGLKEEAEYIAKNVQTYDLASPVREWLEETTKPMGKRLWGDIASYKPGFKLTQVATGFGLNISDAHTAAKDTSLAIKILHKMQDPNAREKFNYKVWWKTVEQEQMAKPGNTWTPTYDDVQEDLGKLSGDFAPTDPQINHIKPIEPPAVETPLNPDAKFSKAKQDAHKGFTAVRDAVTSDEMMAFKDDVAKTLRNKHVLAWGAVLGGLTAISYAKNKLTQHNEVNPYNYGNRSGIRDQGMRGVVGPRTRVPENNQVNGSRYYGSSY